MCWVNATVLKKKKKTFKISFLAGHTDTSCPLALELDWDFWSLHVTLISHHLTKKPWGPSPEPYRQAWEEGAGWSCTGYWCMDVVGRRAMLENPPSILGFKVSGCKCVHGACIRFNDWLGVSVCNPNVHVLQTQAHICVHIEQPEFTKNNNNHNWWTE